MKKTIIVIIVGIVFGSIGVLGATYLYHANEVSYTPSNSNFNVDNVDDAITELYIKVNKGSTFIELLGDQTYKAIVYLDPTNLSAKCNETNSVSKTGTKTGCMKWYVIKDNGSSVDLLLDHNTTAKVAYNTTTPYVEYEQASIKTQVDADTTGWAAGLNPRLITANEIASITNTTTFDGSTSTWFYLNGSGDKKQTRVSTSQGTNEYAWLFDYTKDCTNYGCNIADSSTYGYWTSSPVSDRPYNAWNVINSGYLDFNRVNSDRYGIRPVITINKSVLN